MTAFLVLEHQLLRVFSEVVETQNILGGDTAPTTVHTAGAHQPQWAGADGAPWLGWTLQPTVSYWVFLNHHSFCF